MEDIIKTMENRLKLEAGTLRGDAEDWKSMRSRVERDNTQAAQDASPISSRPNTTEASYRGEGALAGAEYRPVDTTKNMQQTNDRRIERFIEKSNAQAQLTQSNAISASYLQQFLNVLPREMPYDAVLGLRYLLDRAGL